MNVSRRVLARSVAAQLVAGTPSETIVPRLAAYIVDSRLRTQTDQIISDIAYELSRQGVVEATVTTVRPLTKELRERIDRYIYDHERASAVVLDEVVDPALIGGVIIETPSSRLDASVATTLKKLKMT